MLELLCVDDACLRRVIVAALKFLCGVCGAEGCRLMRVSAGGEHSNAVDLYNSASGTWSTAQLSVARCRLAATSVGNVAIFAGGESGNCSFCVV